MGKARPGSELETLARNAAERVFLALDSRVQAAKGGKALLRKAFPGHWSFLLGELALYSLVVLLLTGTYLTLFFDADMTEVVYDGPYAPLQGVRMSKAYESTLEISFERRGGLLVRQIHHWAALVFVASIGLHLLRVFFTGAFRKPRDINWLIGVTLFVLALAEGFSGYSLPDDLLSGTGMRIAQGVMLSIPLVGTYISLLVFGGEFPGHEMIGRLYPIHILLLPGLLLALVVVHLILVALLKHTHWSGPGKSDRNVVGHPMFPQFAARSTGLFFCVFAVLALLGGIAQINPVWNYGPYSPAQVSTASQPDWYVGFLEGSLRLMPPFETALFGHTVMWNVLVPAVVLPGLMFLLLYLYPFFERWITGEDPTPHICDRPRNRPVRTGLGVAAVTFYAVLLAAGGNDVLAYTFGLSLNGLTWVLRTALVLGPPIAFMVTKRFCMSLQKLDAQRVSEGQETGLVAQSVEGTFHPEHRSLPQRQRYTLVAQDFPRPLDPAVARGRAGRIRVAVSRWYYQGSPHGDWRAIGWRPDGRPTGSGGGVTPPAARTGKRSRTRQRR